MPKKDLDKKVLQHLLEQLAKTQETNNCEKELEILIQIGKIYYSNKQFNRSIRYFKRGLECSRKISNDEKTIIFCTLLSLAYYGKRRTHISDQYVEEATNYLMNDSTINKNKIELVKYVADITYSILNIKMAQKLYQYMLTIARELNDIDSMIYALLILGNIEKLSARYDKAIEIYKQAHELIKKVGGPFELATNFIVIGNIYYEWNKIEKTREYYMKAVEKFLEISDVSLRFETIKYLNHIESRRMLFTKELFAFSFYQKAIEIVKDVYDTAERNYLEKLVDISIKLREPSAIEYIQQLIELTKASNDTDKLLKDLNLLGIAYLTLGEPEKAVKHIKKILQSLEENSEFLPIFLNNLGYAYTLKKDYTKAKESFEKALSLAIKMKDNSLITTYRRNLAYVHTIEGSFDEALKLYNEALKSAEDDFSSIAMCTNDIAYVYYMKNDLGNALKYFKKALKSAKKDFDDENIIKYTLNIAHIYRIMKDYENSIKYFIKSDKISDNEEVAKIIVNLNIGIIYSIQQRTITALEVFQKTIQLVQQIINEFGIFYLFRSVKNIYGIISSQEISDYFNAFMKVYEQSNENPPHLLAIFGLIMYFSKQTDYASKCLKSVIYTYKKSNPIYVEELERYLKTIEKSII